jgi:multisubunit Na+/H+ antiporter MnhG subunit
MAARIVLIIFFFLLSAPTGSYIVARFAWNAGVPQWKPAKEGNRRSTKNQRRDSE